MVLLTALAAVAAQPVQPTDWRARATVVQARATVRIISAARISWGRENSSDTPPPRRRTVIVDGVQMTGNLVEFE